MGDCSAATTPVGGVNSHIRNGQLKVTTHVINLKLIHQRHGYPILLIWTTTCQSICVVNFGWKIVENIYEDYIVHYYSYYYYYYYYYY